MLRRQRGAAHRPRRRGLLCPDRLHFEVQPDARDLDVERIRQRLGDAGFTIVNATELPLVCFLPRSSASVQAIVEHANASGEAWIASVMLRGEPCIRACITSFETDEADVDALITLIADLRDQEERAAFALIR